MSFQLSELGFGPFFERQLAAGGDEIPARIAAEHRGAYEVWSAGGATSARLAGRLRRGLDESGPPGVGDWVTLEGSSVIGRVLSRRTVFTRAAAGRKARLQAVAANVDVVFVVCGLDADFNIRRIERYLARIWASGAAPAVILSKADLCDDIAGRLAETESRCIGAPVHAISARSGEGVAAVRASIQPGMTAALVGSSGAGKSTLVNALLGEDRMRTGEIRASDGRGRHVTTHRQLLLLPGGGLVLDTPGMRELQLAGDGGLETVFEEIAAIATRCRFRDCRHDTEPGCAVNEAIAASDLDADRLDHFRKLEREALAYERRHDERLRRQSERTWGHLSDEAVRVRRLKGKP